jgi:hydrogenase maturation protease
MKIVIIGVGNEYRHDDGVGPFILQELRGLDCPGVSLADSDGEPTGLIELWDGADLAIVVDGVSAHGVPGRVYRLGLHHPSAVSSSAASSHGMPLGEAVQLARALGRLPERMLFYGVQVADVTPGIGLTPSVAAAAADVTAEIYELIQHTLQPEVP